MNVFSNRSSIYRVFKLNKFFFPNDLHLPLPLSLGNVALTKKSLMHLPFQNPLTCALGITF